MNMDGVSIRTASPADAGEILDIYSYYVENTAVSFELAVPGVDEFAQRIERTLRRFPYIVAEKDGRILGYSYAGAFKNRAAYDHCAEVTIYLARDARGLGMGRLLYTELERRLSDMGILNLYACIAVTEREDEYLSSQSPEFHGHMGYRLCGRFSKCGYKFGRWYDMVWMEKIIGEHR